MAMEWVDPLDAQTYWQDAGLSFADFQTLLTILHKPPLWHRWTTDGKTLRLQLRLPIE